MKKTSFPLVLLLFLLHSLTAYSQTKYGKTSVEELKMTSYENDSTAVAVILSKDGDTRFVYSDLSGYQFEYTLQVRVKILKSEGLEWCDQEVDYYQGNLGSREEVRGLSGTTYNLVDGKIVKTKLSKENIFEENVDNKYKRTKFTLPAAKVGSVIEYKYTIVSPYLYELRDFYFQTSIPVLHTSYDITIPEYFLYNVNNSGYQHIEGKREPTNETISYRYKDNSGRVQSEIITSNAERIQLKGKNIPAIKKEIYMWTINDYVSKVSFELKTIKMPYSMVKNMASSWEDVDKKIFELESWENNFKKTGIFKKEISLTELSIERASEILDIVKNKAKWNDKNSFYPTNLNDVFKNGLGNSTDLNFLLINALKAGGFIAHPVILSTRGNGRLPMTHPTSAAFDYVITALQIDGTTYYTDASAKYGAWNILPEKCMVSQARILTKDASTWVDLSTMAKGTIFKTTEAKFVDGKQVLKITDTRNGNTAYDTRKEYYSHTNEAKFKESIEEKTSSQIDKFSITGLEKTNLPTKMEYTLTKDADLDADFLYINPLSEMLCAENPFKKEERIYPISFDYLLTYIEIGNIQIPEGYEVEELPKREKLILNENDIMLTYQIEQNNDMLKLSYKYQLKKLVFLPTEYQQLKDFFAKFVLKNSEQIVLKKKTIALLK